MQCQRIAKSTALAPAFFRKWKNVAGPGPAAPMKFVRSTCLFRTFHSL